ncbi:MAG: hypothetical protein E7260_07415 [Lachnospiraceae bacterium]|nr:hypothetical protein [Lachnospiraceae bacterium]
MTSYTYDLLGRLTEVRKDGEQRYKTRTDERDNSTIVYETFTGGTLLAQYTYHADGTLDTMTDGAGTVTDYAYTLHKQVEQMQTVSVSGELLYSESNTYDGNGSLLERTTSGSTVTANTAEYTYDALDRLLSEAVDGSITTYTYDVMGNRLTKNADGVETAYTYDLCNKLLEEVTENPAETATGITESGADTLITTYSYDLVGNLTEKVTPDGTVTYTYDAFNQLTNVTNPDGTWQTSTYDASGIRSMISENGITAEYVSFNGLVIGGYDKDHTKTEHYYYGTSLLATELLTKTEEPDGSKYSTNLYYYVKNSHGDVIALTGNDGTLTETYIYDAFGTLTYIQSLNEEGVLAQTDTALSRFLYAGEQYDEVTGLYYLRARRYDTTVGRFTQEDTYLGDGRNLYVYVQNNPLKYVDPSGYGKETGYINWYYMFFENPWAPDFSYSGEGGMIETTIENLLYIRREIAIAENSLNFGTGDAILDNLTGGILELDDTPKGKDIFYAAGKVRGEIMVMAAELYGAFVVGKNSSSDTTQHSMVAILNNGKIEVQEVAVDMTAAGANVFILAAGRSANRAGDAFRDLLDEVLDEFNELEIKNIIKKIPSKGKERGQCDGFAKRLAKALDDKGIDYQIIRVDSDFGIYSDKAKISVGDNYHYGIQIGDMVYDNMTPEGMKLQNWLDDLGLPQVQSKKESGQMWHYVDDIFNR